MLTLPPLSNPHINTLYVKHKLFDDEKLKLNYGEVQKLLSPIQDNQ